MIAQGYLLYAVQLVEPTYGPASYGPALHVIGWEQDEPGDEWSPVFAEMQKIHKECREICYGASAAEALERARTRVEYLMGITAQRAAIVEQLRELNSRQEV